MTNGQTVIWHCAILFSAFHVVTRVNTSVQLDNIRKIADGKESNGTGRTKESVEWHLLLNITNMLQRGVTQACRD